jgi:hypothetical protein
MIIRKLERRDKDSLTSLEADLSDSSSVGDGEISSFSAAVEEEGKHDDDDDATEA